MATELPWQGYRLLYDAGASLPSDDIRRLLDGADVPGWLKARSAANSDVRLGDRWVLKRIHVDSASGWRQRWRMAKTLKRNLHVQRAMSARGIVIPALVLALRDEQSLVLVYERARGETVRNLIEQLDDSDRRLALMEALARYLAAMHNAGVYHGDLNINNILAQDVDGQWRFALIDNEQNLILPFRMLGRALANMARMWAHARAFPFSEAERALLFQHWSELLHTRLSLPALQQRLQRSVEQAVQRNERKRRAQ